MMLTDEQALALALEHSAGTAMLPAQRAAAINRGREAYARMLAVTDPVDAQGMPPLPAAIWSEIIKWAKSSNAEMGNALLDVNSAINYAQAYGDARAAAERERWEKALRLTWGLVDLHKPWGQDQSYSRGVNDGITLALKTLRLNLDAAIRATTQEGSEKP